MEERLIYAISLTLIEGVGDVIAKRLVSYCGGIEAVFKESKKNLRKIPGIGQKLADAVNKQEILLRAEKEIAFMEKHGIVAHTYLDPGYPIRLKQCADAPVVLYCKGNADLHAPRIISIVGTRNATDYGKIMCEKIISGLADARLSIVSGLAYGIDILAHKYAMQYGMPTIAVFAHGLDRIYPASHRSMAEKMLEQGGWITDFISNTNPDRENFPKRNRIIAGLADAVLVVEAGNKGGALITAHMAASYSRDVFAVPGKATDFYSVGCNRIIKNNIAAMAECAEDILLAMRWSAQTTPPPQQQLFVTLKPEEEAVVSVLKEKGSLHIDDICLYARFTTSKASAILLNLEFAGLIKPLPGKIYQLSVV